MVARVFRRAWCAERRRRANGEGARAGEGADNLYVYDSVG